MIVCLYMQDDIFYISNHFVSEEPCIVPLLAIKKQPMVYKHVYIVHVYIQVHVHIYKYSCAYNVHANIQMYTHLFNEYGISLISPITPPSLPSPSPSIYMCTCTQTS